MDFQKFWDAIKSQLPVIVLALYEAMKQKIIKSELKEQSAEMKLKIRESDDEIDKSNANKSDDDIIREFVNESATPPKS